MEEQEIANHDPLVREAPTFHRRQLIAIATGGFILLLFIAFALRIFTRFRREVKSSSQAEASHHEEVRNSGAREKREEPAAKERPQGEKEPSAEMQRAAELAVRRLEGEQQAKRSAAMSRAISEAREDERKKLEKKGGEDNNKPVNLREAEEAPSPDRSLAPLLR